MHLHPSSVLFSRQGGSGAVSETGWVIYGEVVHTTKTFMRDVTVVRRDWLVEVAPHYYELPEMKLEQH